jgi:hypothetical protein
MNMTSAYSRRRLLALFALAGGAALAGCDRKPAAVDGASEATTSRSSAKAKGGEPMLVYRDPECGCCEAWADFARAEGYAVTVENRADMAAVKTRYGVPDQLASCHTAIIGGYAIEGHVPMRHLAKLLHDKPRDIRGIAVPGMPRGSPGMEMPDGSADAFEVMAFSGDGKVSQFRA